MSSTISKDERKAITAINRALKASDKKLAQVTIKLAKAQLKDTSNARKAISKAFNAKDKKLAKEVTASAKKFLKDLEKTNRAISKAKKAEDKRNPPAVPERVQTITGCLMKTHASPTKRRKELEVFLSIRLVNANDYKEVLEKLTFREVTDPTGAKSRAEGEAKAKSREEADEAIKSAKELLKSLEAKAEAEEKAKASRGDALFAGWGMLSADDMKELKEAREERGAPSEARLRAARARADGALTIHPEDQFRDLP